MKIPYAIDYALFLFVSFSIFSSIRMSKQQKLSGAAYCKLKATRKHKERKWDASLYVFLQKKYVTKAKSKDEDAECTLELGREEHRENVNMGETNIKVEEEFPAEISVVKEIEGDNNDAPKEYSLRTSGKDWYEYEEVNDEVTGNKEIKQTQRLLGTKLSHFGYELAQGS